MSTETSAPHQPAFGMVAGESSGDLLAGLLLEGMRARWPGLQAAGIGGARMQAHGFETWWPQERLAVRGYFEVLMHYPALLGIRHQLRERLLRCRPDVFIGVDAPDFNLALEADLRRQGIRTVHFICPSIWAWRASRVEQLRASADHVLCIFPFEPDLLHRHGVSASYVGYPQAGVIPMQPDRSAARARLGLSDSDTVIALLPGSRLSEIRYLAARFLHAARLLQRELPQCRFVLPCVSATRAEVTRHVAASGLGDAVLVLDGQSHTALEACDATLIASGTATLEAALYKRPMVIAYNMNPLSYQIMRHMKLQPWVGLPNILCHEFVVPELLQDAASPEAMAANVMAWLRAPQRITAIERRFADLHHELLRDTPTLATNAIEKVLHG